MHATSTPRHTPPKCNTQLARHAFMCLLGGEQPNMLPHTRQLAPTTASHTTQHAQHVSHVSHSTHVMHVHHSMQSTRHSTHTTWHEGPAPKPLTCTRPTACPHHIQSHHTARTARQPRVTQHARHARTSQHAKHEAQHAHVALHPNPKPPPSLLCFLNAHGRVGPLAPPRKQWVSMSSQAPCK